MPVSASGLMEARSSTATAVLLEVDVVGEEVASQLVRRVAVDRPSFALARPF